MKTCWVRNCTLIAVFAGSALLLVSCASHGDPTVAHPELAVVKITSLGQDPGHVREASGFFLTHDGLIVTCLHAINPAGEPIITPSGGFPVSGKIVQVDEQHDLALVRVTGAHWPLLPVSETEAEPGTHVRAVNLGGVTHGVFEHYDSFGNEIAFSARVGLNDCGAPLLGQDGHVIGVISGNAPHQSGESIAIPIYRVLHMMPDLPSLQSAPMPK